MSEVEWCEGIAQTLRQIERRDTFVTELIVGRVDKFELWVVSQWPNCDPNMYRIGQKLCTGINVSARFLIDELYSSDLSLDNARSLALLTLTFAAKQSPGGIGEPFEIVVVPRRCLEISEPEVCRLDSARQLQLLESLKDTAFTSP